MKPPAVNGKIIETAPKVPPSNKPTTVPIIAPIAVTSWSIIARSFVAPDWTKIAKSPISWGTESENSTK